MIPFVKPDGTVDLHHFTGKTSADKVVFDPTRIGENSWSKRELRSSDLPRTLFYLDPKTDKEYHFDSPSVSHYLSTVPASALYDLTEDPDKHIPAHPGDIHGILTSIRGAGHAGAYYDNGMKLVMMFHPTTGTRVEDVEAERTPVKAARTQAPAGGMIVNNQFFPGGRMLPVALKSIRETVARRKSRKAGRGVTAGEEPTKMFAFLAAIPAALEALGAAGAGAAAAEGGAAAAGATGALAGAESALGRTAMNAAMSFTPPSQDRSQTGPTTLARRNAPATLIGLAGIKNLVPGTPRRQFSDREIRKIEDAHGLTDDERLKRRVDKSGKVHTRLNDFYEFQDNLNQKKLGPQLHAALNDPATPDDIKMAHLTNHVLADAGPVIRRMTPEEASHWYGASVAGWEAAMHHLFSRERPGDPTSPHYPDSPFWGTFNPETGLVEGDKPWMRLAKAPLAYTSGGYAPTENTRANYRMIAAALRHHPTNPFGNLPDVDWEGYHGWLKDAHEALGLPPGYPLESVSKRGKSKGEMLLDAHRWQRKFGKALEEAGVAAKYSSAPIQVHRDTGEPMGVERFGGGGYIPLPGVSPARLKLAAAQKKLRPVQVPNPGPDGHLKPVSWGRQAAAIRTGNARLARLIGERGESGALEFLDGLQPVSEIKKYNPYYKKSDAGVSNQDHGSLVFGPKYGPFYQNVSGNKDHFTLDKWMARLGYTYMGALMDAKGLRAEGPRSEGDRRLMKEAFVRGAKKLNLPPADLQALLWDMVQRVPNLFGVDHEQDDFQQGGRRLLEAHGFDPGVIEPRGVLKEIPTPTGAGNNPPRVKPSARRGTR